MKTFVGRLVISAFATMVMPAGAYTCYGQSWPVPENILKDSVELDYLVDSNGNLNLDRLEHDDKLSLEGGIFQRSVRLRGPHIVRTAVFSRARFRDRLSLEKLHVGIPKNVNILKGGDRPDTNAYIDEGAYFSAMSVGQSFYITDCVFEGMVLFPDSNFKGNFGFFRSTFFQAVSFSNAAIGVEGAEISLEDNKFSQLSFYKMKFFGNVFVDNCEFDDDAIFTQSTFTKPLSLKNLRGKGRLNFVATNLPDTIYLGRNQVQINMVGAVSSKVKTNLYIEDPEISKLYLNYWNFELRFDSASMPGQSERTVVYEALLKNFKDTGQQESFEALDKEYQQFKWSNRGMSFIGYVLWAWWGFGHSKGYIFVWVAVFLTTFTAITYRYLKPLNEQVYKIENIPIMAYTNQRLWYAFIYTATLFFRLTLKVENINLERKIGVVYIFIVYLVGIICLAYMANHLISK